MAIPEHLRANFDTLLKAALNGDLCLMECADAQTGEPRYVLAAGTYSPTDQGFVFTPFGHLCPTNPYDAYVPPSGEPQ